MKTVTFQKQWMRWSSSIFDVELQISTNQIFYKMKHLFLAIAAFLTFNTLQAQCDCPPLADRTEVIVADDGSGVGTTLGGLVQGKGVGESLVEGGLSGLMSYGLGSALSPATAAASGVPTAAAPTGAAPTAAIPDGLMAPAFTTPDPASVATLNQSLVKKHTRANKTAAISTDLPFFLAKHRSKLVVLCGLS